MKRHKTLRVGILGGGQLGRMMGMAALPLGMEPLFWEPDSSSCSAVIGEHLCAPYQDDQALATFTGEVDVCTFEFENVPSETLVPLAAKMPVYPPMAALAASQDRLSEKQLFGTLGIATAPYAAVDSEAGLRAAVQALGLPAILKTRRFGYDGKGQYVIRSEADITPAWAALGGNPLILEGFVRFRREVSIIAVRAGSGDTAFYALSENIHRNGILHITRARNGDPLQPAAEQIALQLMQALDYVGVVCIELFDVDGQLVVNEFAPRVHNSGHWTIEGAETSQFENHMRAVAGLPLGSTATVGFPAMVNVIGQLPALADACAIRQVHPHFYGKSEKPGRKIAHLTVRATSAAECETRIGQILSLLESL